MSGTEDVVDWNGILEPGERRRILARIHSAFGAVGASMPETLSIGKRQLRLRETVFGYLEKDRLSPKDIEAVAALSAALERKVAEEEARLADGELSEHGAVELMKEVLGVLRALDHLRRLREDPRLRSLHCG